jgi:hypothetical protein
MTFIVFGTNYFIMSSFDGLMPHNFIFTLFAILLYNTIKWYENQKIRYAMMAALCAGLSVLIRPTSIIVLIIPMLWNISGWHELKKRFVLLIKKWNHVAIAGLVFVLALLPQMIYWEITTGYKVYYSYPDEKVNLMTPHLMNVFFSYKKGWLLYTPMMIFAIVGFFFLYLRNKNLFAPLIVFFIINTYVISCWDCWWYGGSFSQRPFVESYVFMAFPLATLIGYIAQKKYYVKLPILGIGLFLVYLNIFQSNQAINGILHTTRTTKEYYWRVFLKNYATEEDVKYLAPTS